MIFFTSGSTGDPKGVCITYENFITCFKSKEKFCTVITKSSFWRLS